jgi:hypothetical protein
LLFITVLLQKHFHLFEPDLLIFAFLKALFSTFETTDEKNILVEVLHAAFDILANLLHFFGDILVDSLSDLIEVVAQVGQLLLNLGL